MTKSECKSAPSDKSNTKLETLNNISSAWKALYRKSPKIPLKFTVNKQNQLMLDGIVIDDLSRISCAETEYYDFEYIDLICADRPDCYFHIHILWAPDDVFYIDQIIQVIHSHSA